jgi:hypothetical protein
VIINQTQPNLPGGNLKTAPPQKKKKTEKYFLEKNIFALPTSEDYLKDDYLRILLYSQTCKKLTDSRNILALLKNWEKSRN